MFVLVPVTFLENSLVLVFDSLQISHPLKYFYPRNLLPKYC